MKYKLVLSDLDSDKRVTMEIEAPSVFDAIDIAATKVENPYGMELIEATPLLGE